MTSSDDFPSEMQQFPFDDRDADAVFGAASGPDSAPEELRDVAELVHAARRAGSADELVGQDVIVAQIAAVIGEPVASPRVAHERTPVLRKFRTAKLTAAATAALMLGATAAAAATGSLPAPVQSSVASGLSGVGINVPSHHEAELAVTHVGHAAKALHHKGLKHLAKHDGPIAFGTVASVNSGTDPGTCGVADTAGTFTLTGHKGATFTVNVDPTTAYLDHGVTTPSFANVCVGTLVLAKGTLTDMTVTATKVFVVPPSPPDVPKGAKGTVASVNGVSDPGTCGVAATAGTFTLTAHRDKTFTVNVDTTTNFEDKDVTTASFLNVCVGDKVTAKGTVVDTTVTATDVFVGRRHEHDDKHEKHHGVFGIVASVNGVSDPNTCGGADAPGTFTLTGHEGATFTVNVDSSTKFYAPGQTTPSFANVCVGAKVGAIGDITDTTVAATATFVLPPHTDQHDGSVSEKPDHDTTDHEKSGSTDADHATKGPRNTGEHNGFVHHLHGH